MPIKIPDTHAIPCTLFLLCGLQREIRFVLLSLEQKALLEAEIHHRLQELVCTAGPDMLFPEQLECLGKPLPNGFGGNSVFTSDLIILRVCAFLFIYLK